MPRGEISNKLTFAELEPLTRFFAAILLALNLPGVPCEEASLLECRAQLIVVINKSIGYAVAHGPCLTAHTATADVDINVEFVLGFSADQRLGSLEALHSAGEIAVEIAMIDNDLPTARTQVYPRYRVFASSSAVVLNHAKFSLP